MPARTSLRWNAGIGLAAQRRHRLGHRPGVVLDLRLELDRAVGEIVALKRFVGGVSWNDRNE